jgi:hypothetical protein
MMSIAWRHGHFRGNPSDKIGFVGTPWYDLDVMLEEHFFLSACARRLKQHTGERKTEAEIQQDYLTITDTSGDALTSPANRYAGSAFDWGTNDDELIKLAIVSGDHQLRAIGSVRIFLDTDRNAEQTHAPESAIGPETNGESSPPTR